MAKTKRKITRPRNKALPKKTEKPECAVSQRLCWLLIHGSPRMSRTLQDYINLLYSDMNGPADAITGGAR